jgi:hypothetical protein
LSNPFFIALHDNATIRAAPCIIQAAIAYTSGHDKTNGIFFSADRLIEPD